MGIEPTMPLLAQSIIGFEDRARHQSEKRFHAGRCHGWRAASKGCSRPADEGFPLLDGDFPCPTGLRLARRGLGRSPPGDGRGSLLLAPDGLLGRPLGGARGPGAAGDDDRLLLAAGLRLFVGGEGVVDGDAGRDLADDVERQVGEGGGAGGPRWTISAMESGLAVGPTGMPALLTRISRRPRSRRICAAAAAIEAASVTSRAMARAEPLSLAARGIARSDHDGEAASRQLPGDLAAGAFVGAGDQRDEWVMHALEIATRAVGVLVILGGAAAALAARGGVARRQDCPSRRRGGALCWGVAHRAEPLDVSHTGRLPRIGSRSQSRKRLRAGRRQSPSRQVALVPIPSSEVGEAVTLVFNRTTEETCAKEVVINHGGDKKIEKALPLNSPVEVAGDVSDRRGTRLRVRHEHVPRQLTVQ
jgi:hypothetical protein